TPCPEPCPDSADLIRPSLTVRDEAGLNAARTERQRADHDPRVGVRVPPPASPYGGQAGYLAGSADRGGGKSAIRSAAVTWKRSTGWGKPWNRQAPRLWRPTPCGSDSVTAARTAEDSTIWPPWPAKQMRAAAWTERPT